jgi:hypothetical protein
MNMTSLINGKHPKQVIIDYYDDLIAQVDIYAEETLKNVKIDEYVNDNYGQDEFMDNVESDDSSELFYQPVENRFKDPYSDKYTFDELIEESKSGLLLNDFVHSERMKAINEIKKLQKDRLEELKLANTKPTTTEEVLFGGNKFCFLVKIDKYKSSVAKRFVFAKIDKSDVGEKMIFKLLAVVVDFYLDKEDIEIVEYLFLSRIILTIIKLKFLNFIYLYNFLQKVAK